MNKDDESFNKFFMKRSQKCLKNKKKNHISFKQPRVRSAQFLRSSAKNSKISKTAIENNVKTLQEAVNYESLYDILHTKKDEKQECFADALKRFFTLSKEEARKTWKDENNSFEEDLNPQNSIQIIKRKLDELSRANLLTETTTFNELFPDVYQDITQAVKMHTTPVSRVPEVTQKELKIKQIKCKDKIRRLLHKEFPAFEKKLKSKKAKLSTYRNEFIFKWFQNDFEDKEKTLESFSMVFKDLDILESTKEFCYWLLKHPEIRPPSYLLEEGIFKNLKTYHVSSVDIAQRFKRENVIQKSLEITDSYIKDHFQNLKFLSTTPSIAGNSLDHRFISDIGFIV